MCNLVSVMQCLVFALGEIMAPPNPSDKSTIRNFPHDSIYLTISSVAFALRLFNVGWIRRYIFLRGKRRSFVAAAMIYTHDFNTCDGCVFSLPDR